MRFLFTLLLLSFSITATAQQKDAIAYKQLLFLYKYKNNKGKRLWPGELKPLLLSRPESRGYFQKYKREQWISNGLAVAALGTYLLSPVRDDPYGKYRGKIDPYKATLAVIISGSLYFSFHAQYQRHKAVKAYNRSLY